MASLTVTDKQDGTGATAGLSGVSGTAVLHVAKFAGDVATAPFVVAGSSVGDGSLDLALEPGSYFAVAIDGAGPTAPVSFRVSDDSQGIHYRCLLAIMEFIQALSLPTFPADPAYHKRHKRPIRTFKEFGQPPHGVHYWMLTEQRRLADNVRDTVVYPVEVALIQGNDGDNVAAPDWTKARELLARGFQACPLPAVPEVHSIEVRPGVLYADVPTALNVDLQSMTFLCSTEQISVFT